MTCLWVGPPDMLGGFGLFQDKGRVWFASKLNLPGFQDNRVPWPTVTVAHSMGCCVDSSLRTQMDPAELLHSGLGLINTISATWQNILPTLFVHNRSQWHQESLSSRSSTSQSGPLWPPPLQWCSCRSAAGLLFSSVSFIYALQYLLIIFTLKLYFMYTAPETKENF